MKLPLREAFSASVIFMMALLVSSPLLIALQGFTPYTLKIQGNIAKQFITIGFNESSRGLCPPTVLVYINRSMLLLNYRGYLDEVSAVFFIMLGVITAYIIAEPLEYKYFFIEATYSGGRLRVFATRLIIVYMLGGIASLLGGVNLAGVAYTLNLFESISEALLFSTVMLFLEALISIAVSSVLSVASRRVSTSILLVLGVLVLMLALGLRYEVFNSVVLASRLFVDGKGVEVYLAVLLVSLATAIWRVDSIEY